MGEPDVFTIDFDYHQIAIGMYWRINRVKDKAVPYVVLCVPLISLSIHFNKSKDNNWFNFKCTS